MRIPRRVPVALLLVALVAACGSVNRDEVDRDAFFVDARVRQSMDGTADHEGTFVELGYNSVDGDTQGLDYAVGTTSFGFGVDGPIDTQGWGGVVGGVGWQTTDFESDTEVLDAEDAIGPWIAIQGGWMATPWLEAYARTEVGLYFKDMNTMFGVQVGARFHVVDNAAFFAGWRYAAYQFNDLDDLSSVDEIELDASGLAVGVELSF
jgi:hypothetical protein